MFVGLSDVTFFCFLLHQQQTPIPVMKISNEDKNTPPAVEDIPQILVVWHL
jgi:hypothetical protein